MTLRGLTWDHPRAYEPLAAFAAAGPAAGEVRWDRQSLAGFEAHPIAELAGRYDLLVVDHPGLGAAVAAGALLPLDTLFDPAELAGWRAGAIGPTWASYTYAGRQWALPIDAATQVSVRRPGRPVPADWGEVPAFAATHRTTLCLGGPHALLTVLAMTAPAPSAAALTAALERLRGLWAHVDQEVSGLDPIGVHEAMAADPALAYCPLAYGYARYARGGLAWAAAPGHGSVLGGTGLAVSARYPDQEAVRRWVRAYLDPAVQCGPVVAAGGQPAALAAWDSAAVDQAWGGYYSATRSSVLAAWVRPRRPGWIAFQDRGSQLVRAAVRDEAGPAAVAAEIEGEVRG